MDRIDLYSDLMVHLVPSVGRDTNDNNNIKINLLQLLSCQRSKFENNIEQKISSICNHAVLFQTTYIQSSLLPSEQCRHAAGDQLQRTATHGDQ